MEDWDGTEGTRRRLSCQRELAKDAASEPRILEATSCGDRRQVACPCAVVGPCAAVEQEPCGAKRLSRGLPC